MNSLTLPDIAAQTTTARLPLDWVGMAGRALEHGAVLEWLGSSTGSLATPHSQRSTATLRVQLSTSAEQLPLLELIERAEAALGTALQIAVKRADEQAFALANGLNLMFCEDAARRLHAHDAVAQSRWRRIG